MKYHALLTTDQGLNTPPTNPCNLLEFGFLKLAAGETYHGESGDREILAVLLGGKASFTVGTKQFEKVGGRPNVFNGKPHAVYIPAKSGFSIQAEEALEIALCYGWIDGQKQTHSTNFWLQKFTPRAAKSVWSQINREKALALIEAGKMKPTGLKEIESAKADGRWDAAYASASKATVPYELQAALDANPRAKAFFGTLNSRNRYGILYRVQAAKKAETRSQRIAQFVEMLERHETLY